jgi:hypothetical protein
MIWLLGGYMFLYLYRPWEIYPSISGFYPERVYMLGVMAYWAVWPHKSFRFDRVHTAMAGFFLVLVVSWMFSAYRDQTFDAIETHAKILVFYVILVTSVRTDKDMRLIVWFFVGAVAIYALHSGWEYLGGRYEFRQDFRRMIGVDQTNNQSNLFAALVVTPLPFMSALWAGTRRLHVRLVVLAFMGLVCLCVAFSGSRGGYITLGAYAFMQAICSKNRKTALALLVICFILLNLLMPGFVINRFMTMIDPSVGPANAQLSAMGRVAGLLAGLRLWSENPLLGTGPYSFIHSSGLYFQAHNMVGQLTGDLGTGGVVTFLALIISCCWNLREINKKLKAYPMLYQTNAYRILQGSIMIMILNLIYGVGGHNLYRFQWYWAAGFNAAAVHCLKLRLEAIAHAAFLRRTLPASTVRPLSRRVQPRFQPQRVVR